MSIGEKAVTAKIIETVAGCVIDAVPTVAVEGVSAVGIVVAVVLIRPGEGGEESGEGRRCRIDAAGGMMFQPGRAAGAIFVAGQRIVDSGAGCAQIAATHGCRGQRQIGIRSVFTTPGALVIEEEEEFVAPVVDLRNPDQVRRIPKPYWLKMFLLSGAEWEK